MKTLTIIIGFLALCVGCSPSEFSLEDMQQYLKKTGSGCSQTQEIGAWKNIVSFKPSDMVAYQTYQAESKLGAVQKGMLDSLEKQMDKYWYFNVQLSADGKEVEAYQANQHVFSQRVQQFSFYMAPYMEVVVDQSDTLDVLHYSYDRTFGMGAGTNFLFVFPKPKNAPEKHIQFYMKDLGLGFGSQKFTFAASDLLEAESITIKSFNN